MPHQVWVLPQNSGVCVCVCLCIWLLFVLKGTLVPSCFSAIYASACLCWVFRVRGLALINADRQLIWIRCCLSCLELESFIPVACNLSREGTELVCTRENRNLIEGLIDMGSAEWNQSTSSSICAREWAAVRESDGDSAGSCSLSKAMVCFCVRACVCVCMVPTATEETND